MSLPLTFIWVRALNPNGERSTISQGDHATSKLTTAGRGGQSSNNSCISPFGKTTAGQSHSTRRSDPPPARPGPSALANHVAHQSHADLIMERYIGEKDKRKEFRDGYREESRRPKTEGVARNLEEWNRKWDELTQSGTTNQCGFLVSEHIDVHC